MSQNGKRIMSEKYFEKDPFLGPLTSNNNSVTCCLETEKQKPIHCTGILLPSSASLLSSLLSSLSSSSVSLVLGLSLTLLGFVTFIVSPQLESALTHLVQTWTALAGGPMLAAWLTPPIVPILKVYLFNITNPSQVLNGLDPVTEEIGPYVYSATHIRRIIEITESGEDLQFRNKVVYEFLPELSVGPETDSITVLNMVMMTAFNKVKSQPSFVKSGVILPLLQTMGRSEPMLNLTVQQFLFGYEEELACLGQIMDSPETEQEAGEKDFWNDDEDDFFSRRRKRRSVPDYRDPETGRCMWGVLRDLNNTEHETVRIRTGQTDFRTKGTIVDMDGKTSFGAWKPECDSFQGSTEPSTLPAMLGSSLSVLVPVMCRTLELTASHTHDIEGIPVTRYTAHPEALAQSPCFCPHNSTDPDSCLPSGYLDLGPCYPDISPPLAVSFPHGIHSPPNSLLTHPPRPQASEHSMYFDINTQLGVPLAARVSFQLSAILRPDSSFPLLSSISSTRLVPLFWASEGFTEPSSWMLSHTRMALALPSAASLGAAGSLLGLGLTCLLLCWWRREGRGQRGEEMMIK